MTTITITFGDRAENHKGMQIIGTSSNNGFTLNDLVNSKKLFEKKGLNCRLINLNSLLDNNIEAPSANVLVVKNFVGMILNDINKTNNDLYNELISLEWDTKALMYGRVVNKHARHNLCFDYVSQEPNYDSGKGRIISYSLTPHLKYIKESLPKYIIGSDNLVGEGNLYYDVSKCGIGYHYDSERKKVVGVRIGNSMPLHYQWFVNNNPVGNNIKIDLDDGDLYIMDEIAKGHLTSYSKKNVYAVKHSAGCSKYTKC